MSVRTAELRDGSRIVIRPIEPDDRAGLAEGFERLSPESRYRRFFGPVAHLSERDLDYLTRVDHRDHEALVAIEEGTGEGVGVARYVRTGPDVAEPAMVVVDDWQGRGAGTRLLDALVERAREEGIRRFEAPVLAYNAESIHLLERLGHTIRKQHGREVELTIDLPEAEAAARVRPLLSQFATGAMEPGRALIERLWPQRRSAPGDPVRNLIVVGTDGSEHAAAAIEAAVALAAVWDATVDVVGVQPFLLPAHPEVTAAVRAAAQALRARGVPVHAHLRRGDPALVLADVAAEENARMIVIGAGEHGKLARRLIGSVADLVAERAPCNVLIVRR
ncbi:MAG TPA: GNAT family N-acetyltransferase [Gaiellales bacterium]|nr:GNAT family N-acetyltransferase [Gaiellales bacterium]